MDSYSINEQLIAKWKPILEHADLSKITDIHRRNATATMLENTEKALNENRGWAPRSLLEAGVPTNTTGSEIDTYDPVLISMVRRTAPNLMAYDLCGVQPMTGPTGLVFAMRSRYESQTGQESFYYEANTAFSSVGLTGANTLGQKHVGTYPGPGTSNLAEAGQYNYGTGMSTAQSEALGASSNAAIPQMSFSIEKVSVTAKSRALKAEYSMELAQDLRAIHGMDAETELANILTTEILAEINREVVRTIYVSATRGANTNTTTQGIFDLDTDSNGRWSVEKFKGLMFQIERECNQISRDTRRGKGNVLICSSDVASALQMAGVLDYAPAIQAATQLQVDDTGNTFAGVLGGRIRVYIDPYAEGANYAVVGFKGPGVMDSGLFYCPYVPLQMVRAVGEDSFQPRIAFKTRYGMVANPYAEGPTAGLGAITKDSNKYYRRILITNLM